jgi:site-specific DNA-methyltransferase (adenine-specific)
MVEVFREVRRVLRDDGTLWLNLGDNYARNPSKGGSGPNAKETGNTYEEAQKSRSRDIRRVGRNEAEVKRAGGGEQKATQTVKEKDLVGIPWRVAFALQADGWYLRQDIIWHKPNPMPESMRDRCTKAHEYIFLLAKSKRYYYDAEAIAEACIESNASRPPHRNRRSVWTVTTKPYKAAHFATFPPDLIEPCIMAGCPEGGTVLDPFLGSGTTGDVARKLGRKSVGLELNADYCQLAANRLRQEVLDFG